MDLIVLGLDVQALSIAAAFSEVDHTVTVVSGDELAVRRQQRIAHCPQSDVVDEALRLAQRQRSLRFSSEIPLSGDTTVLAPSDAAPDPISRQMLERLSASSTVVIEIGKLPPLTPGFLPGTHRAASPISRSTATLLEDIRRQPRFVVGAKDEVAIRRLEALYRPMTRRTIPLVLRPDATAAWLTACEGLARAAVDDRLDIELGRQPDRPSTPDDTRRALDFILAHDTSGQRRPLLEGLRAGLMLQAPLHSDDDVRAARDR